MSDAPRAGVVIIGGAIVGSATATFLAMRPDWRGRIVVVERDLTYRTASTTLSAAAIRLQFSTPLNIELSRFGVHLIKHLDDLLGVAGQPLPEVDFVERGYLFLATAAGVPVLEHNHAVQREAGVEVVLLSPVELRARFPWLTVSDLAAGSLGLGNEGWFDAYALLQAFRAKARSLGVEYVAGEAVAIEHDHLARAVRLADGRRIETDWVVNAAGPRAADVAAMVGTELPVRPRKRNVYHFECRATLEDAPLTIDPSGIYFRPEGPNWISGFSPREGEADPDTLDLEVNRGAWEERVWPVLAHRVDAFQAIRLLDAWAGHYEVNTVDHNAVVGPHPTLPNFLFANGFSGHGLQQAPAVGRGLAEWIAAGRWETLDLSPFGFDRFAANQPIRELNVV
ncbi:MAG TPA: FAD-binding oxidoreductase [Candidatus Limnocylindria bacterium]|nr:FAD-binding oxidoreductase [Candidatus Limnocylindria bacterium]